jgi:hypothetical protein
MVMNRRKASLVLVIIVILSSALFVVVFHPYGTDFHFEEQIPDGENRAVVIRFTQLADCFVDVSFVNDTSLMYSVDVTLIDAGFLASSFHIERMGGAGATEIWVWMDGQSSNGVKSLSVVLGTGTSYDVVLAQCVNVTMTVTYDNGAVIGGRRMSFKSTGHITFILEEDVTFGTQGLEVMIGSLDLDHRPDTVTLSVDLPSEMRGKLWVFDEDHASVSGWPYRGLGVWSSELSYSEPLLDFEVYATSVSAVLLG